MTHSSTPSLADRQSQNLNVYTDTPAVLLNPINQIRRTLARPKTGSYIEHVPMLKTLDMIVMLLLLFVAGQSWAEALPDPTRPYHHKNSEPKVFISDETVEWKLSGIRLRGEQRTAILNGKLIKEGDDLGVAKVIEIRPREVELLHADTKLIVRLLYSDIKHPVNDNSNTGK